MNNIRALLEKEEVETSAPCRIDMGGTLDLSTFYLPLRRFGPCTFNAALNLRTRVKLSPHTKGKLKITSRGFDPLEVDSDQAPFAHPLGLMLALATYFAADGVHIQIDSSSPPRSALGGSSVAAVALVWAFAKVLNRAGQPMPAPEAVAGLAHAVEQSVAGVPCGVQDQLAAVYGGVNGWFWTAQPGGSLFQRQVLVSPAQCLDFSRRLLVAYCGVPHISKDINGTWVREFVAGRHRGQWRQIVDYSRGFIQAIANGQYETAQALMNRETDIRVQLTPEVLDEVGGQLVATARQNHCGARFTGAGGGGCIWALGDLAQIATLRSAWAQVLSKREEAMILMTQVDPTGVL
ncbi:MAG: galactokinase [Desulfobacteraceae bacterium]|nr:galactokinase [Desulfobacteraceae bacterium]